MRTKRKMTASQLANIDRTTHGMSRTSTFVAWQAMIRRCYNPNVKKFKNHGGRGITVCARWLDNFAAFYDDMGEKPVGKTLDRRDNDGPYSPRNCKWSTWNEQARNRRSTRFLTINRIRKSVAEWAEVKGVKSATIRRRIDHLGWSAKIAVLTPARKWRS
jgi:hypothetical protein